MDTSKMWYFNTVRNEPELGPRSPIGQRMGPYKSREEALRAWEIANATASGSGRTPAIMASIPMTRTLRNRFEAAGKTL